MPVITKTRENKSHLFFKSRLFLSFIILFVVFVRVRLLDFPLERDEGEYAYMGQLILQDIPPYSEAYNMKFPGTYLMYAVIMAFFGQTTHGIHMGLIMLNCAAVLLVYLLGRKIVDDFPAAIAGGTYAVLSLSASVFGFAAHATHFVVLPALGGILLLLHAVEKEKLRLYLLSGVLLGVSFIMKQPGIFFVLFGATYIVYRHYSSRPAPSIKALFPKLGALSLGALLPLLITVFWLYATGVFPRFWFWTVVYASRYGSQIPLPEAFAVFRKSFSHAANGFFLLWILAGIGLATTFFHRGFNPAGDSSLSGIKANKVFVVLFVFFSFLSICPGFYFRQHYFVTLLPAVSLLVGILIDFLSSGGFAFLKTPLPKFVGAGIFIAAALVGIVQQKDYFLKDDLVKLSRTSYGANPFLESVEIAKFIETNSIATDRVAVFGSEPQIFFYSKRRSATGYIYMYSLMENHDYSLIMQKEMAHEIESSKPKFIVVVPISTSWLIRLDSEKFILEWIEDYLNKNYSLVGVADILSPEVTIYKWYADARNYTVRSEAHVLIFEKNH